MNAADNIHINNDHVVTIGYLGRFGIRLGLARQAAHMSQRMLADEAKLTEGDVIQIESEKRQPSVSEIRRLARATGSSTDYLLAARPGIDDFYFELSS